MFSRRTWGYLLWGIAALVIAIPEITAAVDGNTVLHHFTTISAMTGHLERHHTWVELVVVAAIVYGAFSSFREAPGPDGAGKTRAGRLTVRPAAVGEHRHHFGSDTAPVWFAVAAIGSFVAITLATLAAIKWWDDKDHYHPSYVLYGLIGLLWLVVPGLVAFFGGKDVPFPTAFQTVANLEDWLRRKGRFGPFLAWLVTYVIAAGLVILLLHLTLYPYPDITHIINPKG
jgi:type II secretory pathway component PulF